MYNGEFLIKVGHEKLFHVLRLDRIYARGLFVVRVEVHDGLPWSRIPDHAALSEELELF